MASRYAQFGGVAGAEGALRQIVAERIEAQMRQAQLERQAAADARAERQLRLSEDTARANREAVEDQRRQDAGRTVAGSLAIGDVLDPQQVATLRVGNLGGHVEHQSETLASRAMGGFGTTPSTKTPSQGMLRMVSNPRQAARDVYRGTPAQRRTHEQQRGLEHWIAGLPPNSPERRALEYQLRTGNNPPAGFLDREPADRYSAHPMFDENGDQIGVGAFNSTTGEFKPTKAGGFLRSSRPTPSTSRQLPERVEGFLMQLRSKHPRYDDALAELSGVLANAHGETFSKVAASNALRQLYAQPTGARDAMAGIDVGSILNPTPSRSAQPHAPAGTGGAMTRAELRAVAQQLGISEGEAEQQARARGLQVR
jgi:hypothetical protein